MKPTLVIAVFLCVVAPLFAQHKNHITATLIPEEHIINVQQEITFFNSSKEALNQLYIQDWNNAFSNKNTPLAQRFSEEFDKSLLFAKDNERGHTKIIGFSDANNALLSWKRLKSKDLLQVQLNFPIHPGQSYTLRISYAVKIPHERFTRYGFNEEGNYYLKNWHLVPAVYDGQWHLYSHLDLDDLYTPPSALKVTFNHPSYLQLYSDQDSIEVTQFGDYTHSRLTYHHRKEAVIILRKNPSFTTIGNQEVLFTTDLEAKNFDETSKVVAIKRVLEFLKQQLGSYPHKQLLITETDYKKYPLYGINQLPSFIRPFPENFQYEMKLLKTTLTQYLENNFDIDLRKERWILDAMQMYLIQIYVETYYPDMKFTGNLSKLWGIRSYNFAQMDYNDQYPYLFMLMARKNIDQPLSMPQDSLVKFNAKIANKYKAGAGLMYVRNYLESPTVDSVLKDFYQNYTLKKITVDDFKSSFEEKAEKDISWFFDTYANTRKKIDFKISKITRSQDSIYVTIKNKTHANVPISLFTLKNDSIQAKNWYTNIPKQQTISLPNTHPNKLVLNYDKIIPEYNQRDNWKSLNGIIFNHRPLQIRAFKDVENPYYNQLFHIPIVYYNYYDGITPGARFYNKSFLEKPFIYDIRPSYGLNSGKLVGAGSLLYRHYRRDSRNYLNTFSLSGSYFHYKPGYSYSTITPAVRFTFRPDDYRSNKRSILLFRNVNVFREVDETSTTEEPNYSVFNTRFVSTQNTVENFLSYSGDFQLSQKFSKLAFTLEYRKLFQNNRQLNLRFFYGKFLHNNTNSDFFSFALDRPTDYLFDLQYLGQSENSGIYSQQIIISEGGFKSKLDNPLANDWMATVNGSTNLWKWIEIYGDAGLLKNSQNDSQFVYDAGIRLNLVTDYFELYFPMYSNNGWEVDDARYAEKIRFIVTLSPRTLLGLFTRKWF